MRRTWWSKSCLLIFARSANSVRVMLSFLFIRNNPANARTPSRLKLILCMVVGGNKSVKNRANLSAASAFTRSASRRLIHASTAAACLALSPSSRSWSKSDASGIGAAMVGTQSAPS
jgi:hypothetical protein